VNYSNFSRSDYSEVNWSKVNYSQVNWSSVDFSQFSASDYREVKWSQVNYSELNSTQLGYIQPYATTVYGTGSNDSLTGNSANNTIYGTGLTGNGAGEIDSLTGGTGGDTFVLGTSGQVFYRQSGNNDFAYISDFTVGKDKVQLSGDYSHYALSDTNITVGGYTGRGLYYDPTATNTVGDGADLIAVVHVTNPNQNALVNQVANFV
jgi:hypothetical protein